MRLEQLLSVPPIIYLAILFACLTLPLIVFAYVTIDSAADTAAASHHGFGKSSVFVSNLVGYVFDQDAAGDCSYWKTTNGGGTWGTAVAINTSCTGIDIWYDQWTPGDTSGTIIHIITGNTTDLIYNTLDTNGDTLSTALDITGANQGGGFASGSNFPTITKATNSILYVGIVDNSDQFVLECSSSCTTNITQWTEVGTGTTVFGLLNSGADDSLLLMPLAGDDILAIGNDVSADDYLSKVWDDGGGAWDTNWTNIDTNAADHTTYTPHMSATLNKSDNDIFFAYLASVQAGNSISDVRAGRYTGGTWSTTTVAQNTGSSTDAVSIAYDMANGRIFVTFQMAEDRPKQTRPIYSLFYKYSTDAMTTWSATSGPIGGCGDTAGCQTLTTTSNPSSFLYDVYGLGMNMMSSFKIFATWFVDGTEGSPVDDILGVIVEDRLSYATHSRVTWAGDLKFNSSLSITGALSKLAGTFVIDHPLDPKNFLLYHSFVESPDAKNIYDGVATLDANGEVTISLPDYFEALNKDFRYQFFPHFEAMPDLYVKQEVKDNKFVIAGGAPNGEISWQVTGTRHDPYILANPIVNEVPKGPDEIVDIGECLFEPLCR